MPTLLRLLMARPETDLPALAATWGVSLADGRRREATLALYRAMTDRWAVRDVLEVLSPVAARWLWRHVRGLDTPTEPTAAGTELVAAGLLHVPAGGAATAATLADETAALLRRLAAERQSGDLATRSLSDLLTTLGSIELATALEHWTGQTGPLVRQDAEAALLAAISVPLARDDMVARLAGRERLVFGLLDRADRPVRLTEVRRRARLPPPALRDALRRLNDRLLVWEAWRDRRRWLFVPRELRRSAGRHALRPVTAAAVAWCHPYGLAWDVLAGLRFLSERPGDRSAGTGPWPIDYPLWGAVVTGAALEYRRFAAAAVAAVGQRHDREAWAARSLIEQQRALVDMWRETGMVGSAVTTSDSRSPLLTELTRLDDATWYPLEAVARAVALAGAARRSGMRGGRAVVQALRSTLMWLGLVELGQALDDQAYAVRLTPFGAWCLKAADRPPADEASVIVEPSQRVLVYAADAALLWSLLAFAAPDHLDRVSLFRLSRADAQRGLSHGLSAGDMVAALARVSRHELPQGVVYALRDWTRPAVPSRIDRTLLLTFDDTRARDAALIQPRLRRLDALPVGTHLIAVPIPDAAAEDAARATLRLLGLSD